MIPEEVLTRLAIGGSMLEERLEPPFVPTSWNHADLIEGRIARWTTLGAKGDRERLRRSLHWRGIDLDRISPALGSISLLEDAALPEWVLRFTALLEAALTEHRHAAADPPPVNECVAVMTSFVRAAAKALHREIPAKGRDNISESTFKALEQSLLLRLTRLAGPVLGYEYFVYSYTDSRAGGEPETRGQRFADHVLHPPIPEFLAEYPVLARLLTLACDNWQAAALELIGRLANDRQAIIDHFHRGLDPGLLVDIKVGDADVHDGHREVVVLVFENGFKVAYKPRSLVLDRAFHEFVHWLNERGLSPSLRSPAVLCRDGYGWAEFIAHCPADGLEELALFYERAGVLACVAYVMGATDLHYGNMIAHSGYPIIVDLETLLKAEPRSGALPTSTAAVPTGILGNERSVLQSMLLPLIHRTPTGVYADVSALGAGPGNDGARQNSNWLPVHDASLKQLLREHAPAIEKGFVSAYRFIEQQSDALLSECGPLAAFAHCPIRVVLRDTALYFQLLRHSITPSVLRDGSDRGITLERLNHVVAIADTPPSFVDIVTREQMALTGLDVPRFLVMTDETDLRDGAGVVAKDVMERTPLAEMRLRIEAMGEPDLQRQCKDIRLALSGYIAEPSGLRREGLPSATGGELPDAATLIVAAERLGADLLEDIAICGDAPPPWRGIVYLSAARRFTVGDAGAGFADGGLGIAMFLAALFRVTRETKWRKAALDLSLRYLTPLANSAGYNGHIAGGIMTGLGGSLYGVATISALIESEEILENGLALARRLAARAIVEEKDLSLGDGLAGTLLGIASLRRLASDAGLDDIIERGAARLRDAKPLPTKGLLSGHAGLILALNAIGLTDTLSIPDASSSDAAMDWAEGAIGLSLVALKTQHNISRALDFFRNFASVQLAADDSFAFGTAGEVDALVWAAQYTNRSELCRLALQRIVKAVERALCGTPRLLGGTLGEKLRIPGLLHGSAGIGYAMLRLAAPDRLPALAVFELALESKSA